MGDESEIAPACFARCAGRNWISPTTPLGGVCRSYDYEEFMNQSFVINLISRPDRRRNMEAELASAGWPGPVEWLTERRPKTRDKWLSPAHLGCFMGHFKALIRGRDSGVASFTVFEDDCKFVSGAVQRLNLVERGLEQREWDLCYFGHYLPQVAGDEFGLAEIPSSQTIFCAHAYLV